MDYLIPCVRYDRDIAMRTVWDLLTAPTLEARVTHPHRPSHALVTLPNSWQVSITVSPASWSSLGRRFAEGLEEPISTVDIMGHAGSPEDWFDRADDAEVSIIRPDGTWYHCENSYIAGDPHTPQPWRYVSVEEVARLIERVRTQPAGCLCPYCADS